MRDIFLRYNLLLQITPEAGCHGNKINVFHFSVSTKGKQTVQEPSSDMAPPALAMFYHYPSAQQQLKESRGPSVTHTKKETKHMPNNLVQIQNKTALHFASNYTNGSPFVGLSASKPWS